MAYWYLFLNLGIMGSNSTWFTMILDRAHESLFHNRAKMNVFKLKIGCVCANVLLQN